MPTYQLVYELADGHTDERQVTADSMATGPDGDIAFSTAGNVTSFIPHTAPLILVEQLSEEEAAAQTGHRYRLAFAPAASWSPDTAPLPKAAAAFAFRDQITEWLGGICADATVTLPTPIEPMHAKFTTRVPLTTFIASALLDGLRQWSLPAMGWLYEGTLTSEPAQ